MIFDLHNQLDRAKFDMRVQKMRDKGCIVELTEKVVRSLNQNAYLHACIGVVAMEVGVSLEYAKREYFKRLVNSDIFVVTTFDKIKGIQCEDLRSSAKLTKEEMSKAIDRFKRWAYENEIYLPEPGDDVILAQINYELQRRNL